MKLMITVSVLALLGASSIAQAGYPYEWHRQHWNEGRWVHDRHGGRLGWWWVIGPTWHFFPHPIAQPSIETVIVQQPVQPMPQMIVAQPVQQAPMQPPPQAVSPTMYYCKATGTYYPETMSCPGGWATVMAGQPPVPIAPIAPAPGAPPKQ